MDVLGIAGSLASILSLTVELVPLILRWTYYQLSRPLHGVSVVFWRRSSRYKRSSRTIRTRINLGFYEYKYEIAETEEWENTTFKQRGGDRTFHPTMSSTPFVEDGSSIGAGKEVIKDA